MPVALERELKAKVAKKKMSKERKDAYVYGTLRKTGWKPEREKKMSDTSKLVRLSEINKGVESLIEFDRHDATDVAAGGALALGGVGLYKAHKTIRKTGGYGQFAGELGTGYKFGKQYGGGVGVGQSFKELRKGLGVAPGEAIGSALGTVRAKIGKFFHLKSKEKPIEFADLPFANQDNLGPFQAGDEQNSKLYQVQFPAGLSPLAALQLPLPQLMVFLSQRNHLQQQFSRKERLIQFSAKLDEINFETEAERFNRAYEHYRQSHGAVKEQFNKAGERWISSDEFKQGVHDTSKKLLIGAGGVGGVSLIGLGGYKLHQRGLKVPGAKSRGITGNIVAGAKSLRNVR